MNPPSFHLLNVDISTESFEAAVQHVLLAPETNEAMTIHFATVHSLVEAQRNPALRAAFGRGKVYPDGMPLVWLGRQRGLPIERVCGPDFMPALMNLGRDWDRRHYLYGARPEALEGLVRRLSIQFPGLAIVGSHAPPFRSLSAGEQRADVDRINAAQPDYVWVGLGAPKQDLWAASNRESLSAAAVLAVGAAFDFLAGRRRRAPAWMQRSGTEWLFRLASEPGRLAGRYTATNAHFAWLLLRDAVRNRLGR